MGSRVATGHGVLLTPLRGEHIHDEIGEIVAGRKPGRESARERILFWHKGFAISDIVLGHLAYEKTQAKGIGTVLSYYRRPQEHVTERDRRGLG